MKDYAKLKDYLFQVKNLEQTCYTYENITRGLQQEINTPHTFFTMEQPKYTNPYAGVCAIIQGIIICLGIPLLILLYCDAYCFSLSADFHFLDGSTSSASFFETSVQFIKYVFSKSIITDIPYYFQLNPFDFCIDFIFFPIILLIGLFNETKRIISLLLTVVVLAVLLIFGSILVIELLFFFIGLPKGRKNYHHAMITYKQYQGTRDNFQETEQERLANLAVQLEEARRQHRETRETLDKLYSLNIVYPRYRAIVPITMFCEYIESKRCTQLEGHEGAYNLYEEEIRLNRIVTQLNSVIQKLDQIQENQYMLYETLQEGNQISQSILTEVHENNHYAQLAAYNSQVTAENTRSISNMQTFMAGMQIVNYSETRKQTEYLEDIADAARN